MYYSFDPDGKGRVIEGRVGKKSVKRKKRQEAEKDIGELTEGEEGV